MTAIQRSRIDGWAAASLFISSGGFILMLIGNWPVPNLLATGGAFIAALSVGVAMGVLSRERYIFPAQPAVSAAADSQQPAARDEIIVPSLFEDQIGHAVARYEQASGDVVLFRADGRMFSHKAPGTEIVISLTPEEVVRITQGEQHES